MNFSMAPVTWNRFLYEERFYGPGVWPLLTISTELCLRKNRRPNHIDYRLTMEVSSARKGLENVLPTDRSREGEHGGICQITEFSQFWPFICK